MKVARAAFNGGREIVKRQLFLTFLDKAARLGDECRVFSIDREAIGVAPLAGPEPGRLRVLERVVQLHVLWIGGSRRTGRTAIDSRRRYRIPEPAVSRAIARDNVRPTRIVGYDHTCCL